ncbi:hypothetical protein CKA32_001878 [Geitlerinema sp. FC II]|nr:hypothetical protein CKA32_001878 [Geitlerinema sp. FC II]
MINKTSNYPLLYLNESLLKTRGEEIRTVIESLQGLALQQIG